MTIELTPHSGPSGGPEPEATMPAPKGNAEPPRDSRIGADLSARVGAGLIMAGITLAAELAGGWIFTVLLTLVAAVVSWEWSRIVRGDIDLPAYVHVGAVIAAVLFWGLGYAKVALVLVVLATAGVGILSIGQHGVLSGLGVAYAALPTIALVWLRADEPFGGHAVLFLMLVVVATDTAAYFSGRLIGGPKLWPRVSPKKTWAGLIGGMAAAAAVGAMFAYAVPIGRPVTLGLFAAFLAVVAQAGDMAESALKRHFGAKDASSMIPGHGGFMDRVDGLVTVALMAALVALLIDATAPGRALLLLS